MEIKDFKVGQKVWVLSVGNAARRFSNRVESIEERISEDTVTKVGNKYIYLENTGYNSKFGKGYNGIIMDISNYTANYHVYTSKQEILDEHEADKLVNEVRNQIGHYGKSYMTLDQLKRIKAILDEIREPKND